jgi:hypothetical protein
MRNLFKGKNVIELDGGNGEKVEFFSSHPSRILKLNFASGEIGPDSTNRTFGGSENRNRTFLFMDFVTKLA